MGRCTFWHSNNSHKSQQPSNSSPSEKLQCTYWGNCRNTVSVNRKIQYKTSSQQVTDRKFPDDFFVNDPGPLGTVSDKVMTSKPTQNDLQSNYITNNQSPQCSRHWNNVLQYRTIKLHLWPQITENPKLSSISVKITFQLTFYRLANMTSV